jgi:hypothetical protein
MKVTDLVLWTLPYIGVFACQDNPGKDVPDGDKDAAPCHASWNESVTEAPYDGIDNDCDPLTPDDDLDGDGYANLSDCDDGDPTRSPSEVEVPYNGIDNDCDPLTPDDDLDGDGFANVDDCDDEDPSRSPAFDESYYDGTDNDCDPDTRDDDQDGDDAEVTQDCDDRDARRSPFLAETVYDGIDNDCDPLTPDDDLDGDGYANLTDCDDGDPLRSPSEVEVPYDGIDNDCDPLTLDDDLDDDGFANFDDCDDEEPTVYPESNEVFDGLDNDCDGVVDNTGTWRFETVTSGVYTDDIHITMMDGSPLLAYKSDDIVVRKLTSRGWTTSTPYTYPDYGTQDSIAIADAPGEGAIIAGHFISEEHVSYRRVFPTTSSTRIGSYYNDWANSRSGRERLGAVARSSDNVVAFIRGIDSDTIWISTITGLTTQTVTHPIQPSAGIMTIAGTDESVVVSYVAGNALKTVEYDGSNFYDSNVANLYTEEIPIDSVMDTFGQLHIFYASPWRNCFNANCTIRAYHAWRAGNIWQTEHFGEAPVFSSSDRAHDISASIRPNGDIDVVFVAGDQPYIRHHRLSEGSWSLLGIEQTHQYALVDITTPDNHTTHITALTSHPTWWGDFLYGVLIE